MTHAVVEVQSLSKVFRSGVGGASRQALKDVSLTVPMGSVFGLIGPNGAGKTTLIKALLGILQPSAGDVRLFGIEPQDPSARQHVGYLPERLELPKDWTPRMFLRSVGRLKRIPALDDEVDRQLHRVGLDAESTARVGRFSKGMKQRLGLASALLGSPRLLVLDEPTDGIDPLQRMGVRNILKQESSRGATIMLNSHLLAETEKICDRIGILHRGVLLREAALSELIATEPRWIVRVEGDVDLEPFGLERISGAWRLTAPDAARVNEVIDSLREKGVQLTELSPDLPDLEAVLGSAVEGA